MVRPWRPPRVVSLVPLLLLLLSPLTSGEAGGAASGETPTSGTSASFTATGAPPAGRVAYVNVASHAQATRTARLFLQDEGREEEAASADAAAGPGGVAEEEAVTRPLRLRHTNNWAVLVGASRYWFNYRHVSNTLSFYRTVKR